MPPCSGPTRAASPASTQAPRGARVDATTRLTEEASIAARARRGAFNVSGAGSANLLGEHELVDDVARGRVDLAAVPPAELPPAIAALPVEQRRERLAETGRFRGLSR